MPWEACWVLEDNRTHGTKLQGLGVCKGELRRKSDTRTVQEIQARLAGNFMTMASSPTPLPCFFILRWSQHYSPG